MACYDYLWWDNSQLHKDGRCGAASCGACLCVPSEGARVDTDVCETSERIATKRSIWRYMIRLSLR